MSWKRVGEWLKDNAGSGAKLVGSLLTGNAPGAIAAGVALVSSATGHDSPDGVLAALQNDPATVLRLRELAAQNEADIRKHIETMRRLELENEQKEHEQTQATIRGGDASMDEFVRRVRPQMAIDSWKATVAYCLGCWVAQGLNGVDLFDVYLAGFLSSPAWAYLGLRTADKFAALRRGA